MTKLLRGTPIPKATPEEIEAAKAAHRGKCEARRRSKRPAAEPRGSPALAALAEMRVPESTSRDDAVRAKADHYYRDSLRRWPGE